MTQVKQLVLDMSCLSNARVVGALESANFTLLMQAVASGTTGFAPVSKSPINTRKKSKQRKSK